MAKDANGQPVIINGHKATVAEMIARTWARDKKLQEKIIEAAFGKVPQPVEIGGVDGKSITFVIKRDEDDDTPYPKQHDFYTCPDRIAAYIGGIRSGKTYAGVLWALQQATQPNSVVLIVAPTYPMLRDVDWVEAQKFVGQAAVIQKSEMAIEILGGGRILFRSARLTYASQGTTYDVRRCR